MAFRGIQATNIISTDVGLTDPLLILNKGGSTAVDVGFLGKIGTTSYAGLVKDSATNEFLLLGAITLSPNTVNDVSALDASIVKGNISVGTLTGDVEVNTTFVLPKGTTAQHPASPVEGQMWFNTETKMFEGYDGTAWIQMIPSTYVYTP
jgi:hypothetical protein|tara:strand:- start:808 stop:1257 length:450 start_codon:yes stop_codon:yes gene_type:complete